MSKSKSSITKLSTEHEILQILQEECGEVIQAASKCVRFGSDNFKLDKPHKTNIEELLEEIGDLLCIVDIMHRYDMLPYTFIEERIQLKYEKLKKYSNLDL